MSDIPKEIKDPKISSDAELAVDALLNETRSANVTPPPVVKKPNINTPEGHKTLSDVAGHDLTDDQAMDMINRMNGPQLMELARRIEAVKEEAGIKQQEAQKPRYFTEAQFKDVKESDIYNFNVPIKTIDHQLPDYLDIKLKDANYIARWINLDPRRLGQAIAEGWSYIRPDDLARPLEIKITDSADGHYIYADVVAMKLTKEKVYGRIRGNFLKSLQLTKSTLALHEHMKNLIKSELSGGEYGEQFQKYNKENAMGVYTPLAGA